MAVTGKHSRYRYISTLGSGGMATVVLAEDTVLGRQVALKRMIAAADPNGLSRLRREALAGASLSHPNLVSIYDVVTSEEGDLVIVMEYVRGETLRDALSREARLPVPQALRILEGVAAGLDTIHRQGIVHRDVKPPNILLGVDGTVKVADLGIASVPDRTKITSAGAVIGSFSYMAPEQLEDAPTTPAIDIYALAAVAFEVLSGVKARREPNPVALAHAISTQPPPDLREAWPQAPKVVAELLTRGMARDPAARPNSASELIGRLRSALEPVSTAPIASPTAATRAMPPRTERDGNRAAAAGAGAVVAADQQRRGARGSAPRDADMAGSGRRDGERAVAARGARGRGGAPRASLPPASGRGEPRRWPVLAALLGLAAAAVVLAVLLNSGGSQPRTQSGAAAASSRSHASHTTTHTTGTTAARSGSATAPPAASSQTSTSVSSSAAAPAPGAAPAPRGAGSPVSAVESFYQLAASHQYAQAWALADPTFRSQLGGYQSFQSGQQGDRSITFNSAHVVTQSGNSATVAVRTTSVRTDGTHQCAGTVDLVRGGSSGQWLMHLIHINCT